MNDRIVHGIPSRDEVLREGDLISIDFGAIVEGWHGDAAVTVAIGAVAPAAAALSAACEAALWDGLAAAAGRRAAIRHLARGRDLGQRLRATTAS